MIVISVTWHHVSIGSSNGYVPNRQWAITWPNDDIFSLLKNKCTPSSQCFNIPDSKVHEANMGPNWSRQDPGGPHVGPMNFAIWDLYSDTLCYLIYFSFCSHMMFYVIWLNFSNLFEIWYFVHLYFLIIMCHLFNHVCNMILSDVCLYFLIIMCFNC